MSEKLDLLLKNIKKNYEHSKTFDSSFKKEKYTFKKNITINPLLKC